MIASEPPRVLVLGAGFGGLEAAFYLRMRVGSLARITLVSDQERFLFKPNTIYIPFGKDPADLSFPVADAARRKGIEFVLARATRVDPDAKKVVMGDGTEVPYDHLVIATGATMRPEEVPGLKEHANTIWTVDEMLRLRESFTRLVDAAAAGREQRVLFVVPPHNKCSGPLYEMVMMLDTWLRRKRVRGNVGVAYATYEKSFIQAFGPRLHEVVATEFEDRGIAGHTRKVVASIEQGKVHFEDGDTLPFDLLVSFPPYAASTPFPDLPSDGRGFIATDPTTRQVVGIPDVYAVGDSGDFPVKQAFLALLQADAVGERIASRILGVEPQLEFEPVSMCIMEQFDKATFAQVPLRLTGDPDAPVAVNEDRIEDYLVGSGEVWRMGKKMLGAALPYRFRHAAPFHAGATWKTMEAGLKVMSGAFAK